MAEKFTTNYEKIRTWVESHDGFPAVVSGVSDEDYEQPDILEISFDPENPEVKRITWDELFEWIEQKNLALRYDNKAPRGLGAFEFVDRDRVRSELAPESELPDSGSEEESRDNVTPDDTE